MIWWRELLILMVFLQITFFWVSGYMHRGKTHRAITFHPFVDYFGRVWLWAGLGQSLRDWIAIHRIHHQHSDVEGDPHSPKIFGFWNILLAGEYYYGKVAGNRELLEKNTRDIPHVWSDCFLDNMWLGRAVGAAVATVCYVLLAGWWGLLIGPVMYFLHMYLYWRAGGIINGLCHTFGYRNWDDNLATNVFIFGLLLGGEGYHNNHHHDQSSPKLGYRSWEFDPSWFVIRVLIFCRLAKLNRVPAVA